MVRRLLIVLASLLPLTACGGSQFGALRGPLHRWFGPPARFVPAHGWRVRTSGPAPISGEMRSVTVAGTVPWRGVLELAPPNRTLRELHARDGIVIYVELDAEANSPPSRPQPTSLQLGSVGPTSFGEGPPLPGIGSQEERFVAGGEYDVYVLVLYGRLHPSPGRQEEAHAEVMRLVLSRWPRPNAADG